MPAINVNFYVELDTRVVLPLYTHDDGTTTQVLSQTMMQGESANDNLKNAWYLYGTPIDSVFSGDGSSKIYVPVGYKLGPIWEYNMAFKEWVAIEYQTTPTLGELSIVKSIDHVTIDGESYVVYSIQDIDRRGRPNDININYSFELLKDE